MLIYTHESMLRDENEEREIIGHPTRAQYARDSPYAVRNLPPFPSAASIRVHARAIVEILLK